MYRYELTGEFLSNLSSGCSGIDGVTLWVAAGEFENRGFPGPRVVVTKTLKVDLETFRWSPVVRIFDGVVTRGSLDPDLLQQIQTFITQNKKVLIDYWGQKICTSEMIDGLVRLGPIDTGQVIDS